MSLSIWQGREVTFLATYDDLAEPNVQQITQFYRIIIEDL